MEPPSAADALGDLVVPTVDEEECAFLRAQNTRATTIEMTENPEAKDEGVIRRDRSRALRARRGLPFRHWSNPPNAKGTDGRAANGHDASLRHPGCSVVGVREGSIAALHVL